MKIERQTIIKVELTEEEKNILTDAQRILRALSSTMDEFECDCLACKTENGGDYNYTYDDSDLDVLIKDLGAIKSIMQIYNFEY